MSKSEPSSLSLKMNPKNSERLRLICISTFVYIRARHTIMHCFIGLYETDEKLAPVQ